MLRLKSGIYRFTGLDDYNKYAKVKLSKYHQAERLEDIFRDRRVLSVSTKGGYIYVEYN